MLNQFEQDEQADSVGDAIDEEYGLNAQPFAFNEADPCQQYEIALH